MYALIAIFTTTIVVHAVGSAVLTAVVWGPATILEAPLLAVFSIPLLPFELAVISIQWLWFDDRRQSRFFNVWVRTVPAAAILLALTGPQFAGAQTRWFLAYICASTVAGTLAMLILRSCKPMERKNRAIEHQSLKLALAIGLLVFATIGVMHFKLWSQALSCRIQHADVLGRSIAFSFDHSEAMVIVPGSAEYSVREVAPYYYELHLRTGHQFPSNIDLRNDESMIAYFAAEPRYPWWYVVDIFDLKSAEVIALDETYSVSSHPVEWITSNGLSF